MRSPFTAPVTTLLEMTTLLTVVSLVIEPIEMPCVGPVQVLACRIEWLERQANILSTIGTHRESNIVTTVDGQAVILAMYLGVLNSDWAVGGYVEAISVLTQGVAIG